jgi:hypothetical protein
MAEIDIEKRPRQSWWPWALAAFLLLIVVGTAWYLAGPEGDGFGDDTPSSVEPEPRSLPSQPGAGATPGDPGRP